MLCVNLERQTHTGKIVVTAIMIYFGDTSRPPVAFRFSSYVSLMVQGLPGGPSVAVHSFVMCHLASLKGRPSKRANALCES
jgi:hypothetical protein